MLLDSTPENDIAERLRLWRKTALELTQKEFAEATGVHLSAIRKYENRNSVPSSESLLAIASTGVDLHWLLTGEGDMRALAKRLGSAANTEGVADLVHGLMAIEELLHGIPDHKRSAVLDEIVSRVREVKRVAELETLVAKLQQERGHLRKR
ncbi:MAG: helix-turn-helix domain-containing protein [Comamonadaceae bacterium]|jgi:transcriptional regulator with XRE-family HTH domain|uniref:helix-turn-helix domain-containing protein n=1 Tax=Candidatus Skiveiella danica TaxID=3386177 RepID=UPI00390A05C1|nr:helix-turn-helix domain-containing protein [Comamonadaceae bacterium]